MNSQEASLSSFPLDSSSELSIAWRRQREWVWWGWWRRASAAIETRNITQRLHCLNVYCVLERVLFSLYKQSLLSSVLRDDKSKIPLTKEKKIRNDEPAVDDKRRHGGGFSRSNNIRNNFIQFKLNFFFSSPEKRKNSQLQELKVYKWDEMEAFPSIPNKIHISFPSLNRSLHDCETTAMIDAEEDGEKLWKWKIWCFH